MGHGVSSDDCSTSNTVLSVFQDSFVGRLGLECNKCKTLLSFFSLVDWEVDFLDFTVTGKVMSYFLARTIEWSSAKEHLEFVLLRFGVVFW